MDKKKWVIKYKGKYKDLISVLLKNRGITSEADRKLFYYPTHPDKLDLKDLGIDKNEMQKAVAVIKKIIDQGKHIVIFGDYDTDGITASAILWETVYAKHKKTSPYIPDRFEEGYGINATTVRKLISKYPDLGLIITVDNGIVAYDAVKEIKDSGVSVVVSDHHEAGEIKPQADATIHTTSISGSAVSWILARDIRKGMKIKNEELAFGSGLELAAIGTVADVLPLVGPNRSFVQHGIRELNNTSRPGLRALAKEAAIDLGRAGVYHIGYVISPRINAMGRLKHGIDSLRLLCTNSQEKATQLSYLLGKTNKERQKVVEEVVSHAKKMSSEKEWDSFVIVSHKDYHEGVIGLAAAKLVEEFWRPAIVFSEGDGVAKASARSIPGFNLIEIVREMDDYLLSGGGHTMAAGFSIKSDDLQVFTEDISRRATEKLTDEILCRSLILDAELSLRAVNYGLLERLSEFEPTGPGNPSPSFASFGVEVVDAKVVGKDSSHIKMILAQEGNTFDAIGFNLGKYYPHLSSNSKIDIAYSIEENVWNGNRSIQLKLKDIHI